MLPVAVARSSSDDIAIRYVLPVLWMTSYFHIMGPITRMKHYVVQKFAIRYQLDVRQLRCLFEFARMRHWGKVYYLRLPCYVYSCGKPFRRTWKRTPSRTKSTSVFRRRLPAARRHGNSDTVWRHRIFVCRWRYILKYSNRFLVAGFAIGLCRNAVQHDNSETVRIRIV